jgi:hypothetical protein
MRTKLKAAQTDVTAQEAAAVLDGTVIVDRGYESPEGASGLATKDVVERWRVRRQQSAEALASLGLQAMHAQSPEQIVGVWMTWSCGVLDRMVADTNDHLALGTLVSRKLVTNTTELAKSWSHSASTATDRSAGGTGIAS